MAYQVAEVHEARKGIGGIQVLKENRKLSTILATQETPDA